MREAPAPQSSTKLKIWQHRPRTVVMSEDCLQVQYFDLHVSFIYFIYNYSYLFISSAVREVVLKQQLHVIWEPQRQIYFNINKYFYARNQSHKLNT